MSHVRQCFKCGEWTGNRNYCKACQAAYVRMWRRLHGALSPEAKKKDIARSYANVYKKRGKIAPKPCEVCGGLAQMHHDDYDKPLEVRWMCRTHHLEWHRLND